jgi:hypothetical protein
MVSREELFVRVVLPHLLFAPVVAYYVRRDAIRREHPHPTRAGLLYGALGIPGVLLYEIRG